MALLKDMKAQEVLKKAEGEHLCCLMPDDTI